MLIFMILTSQVEGSQKKPAAGDILPTVKMNATWYPFYAHILFSTTWQSAKIQQFLFRNCIL